MRKPVIQGNKPPPQQVTFLCRKQIKWEEDRGMADILLSSNPPALFTHAESVSVCKASLPAAWLNASETGIEREEGWASAHHQEVS